MDKATGRPLFSAGQEWLQAMTPVIQTQVAILSIERLQFSYSTSPSDDAWKLRVEKFSVHPRQITIVSGTNMSGKSTFLNIVAGMIDVQLMSDRQAAPTILLREQGEQHAILLSNDDEMFPELSVWDNVRLALPHLRGADLSTAKRECASYLIKSGVFAAGDIERPLGTLSTGGQAIVKLCRAVLTNMKLLVVDELTSYLDDNRARFFITELVRLADNGASVVIVSHSARDKSAIRELGIERHLSVQECAVVRRGNISSVVNQEAV